MIFVAFSLLLLISLFIFNCCHFNYSISWCVPFWVLLYGTLCFLDLGDCFLSQVRQVFSLRFSDMFSACFSLSSPSRTCIMGFLVCLMLSQRSLKLSSFHFFFFFLFTGNDFYHCLPAHRSSP